MPLLLLTWCMPGVLLPRSYESLQPLHQLWAAYISRLVEGQPSDLAARLLGADYHGCLMSVERSPNPAWAGVAGIVAKATASTFQLVSQGNRLHGECPTHAMGGQA